MKEHCSKSNSKPVHRSPGLVVSDWIKKIKHVYTNVCYAN